MGVNETGTITLKLLAQDLASGNVGKFIGNIDRLAKQGGLMGSVMQGVGQSFGQMLNPVALVSNAIGTVTNIMGDSIGAASDQAEALSKVTVVFGDQADTIARWAQTASTSMGMSETAALSAAGTLGNLFDALNIAEGESAKMSKAITQLAADLGSFNNVASEEAMTALQSGLLGETEPMRRFGANLSAARVEAYALAKGMAATKGAITDAIKVQARYELILEDTKNAQGDFARTSDGLANSQKTLDAKMADLSVTLGKFLEGPAKGFVGFLTDVIDSITNPTGASPALQAMIADIREASGAVKAATGPMETYAQGLARVAEEYEEIALQMELGQFTKQSAEAQKWADQLGHQFIAMSGQSVKAFRMLAEASQAAGETFPEFRARAFALANGTTSTVIRMVDAWTLGMGQMGSVTEVAGQDIYGGLVRPVKRSFRAMFQTMAAAKEPWKEAWREMAAYAKNPFRPNAFENWLEKRAEKAIEKARQAADNGKPGVASRWRALAAVMKRPVLAALAETQEEIDALIAAMQTVMLVNRTTGMGRMGSTEKVAGRHAGGPVQAGVPYIVGEKRAELFVPDRSGTILPSVPGGMTVNVHLHGIVAAPSEADGQRIGRVLGPIIQREMQRAGAR